jgi:hypothetical protein
MFLKKEYDAIEQMVLKLNQAFFEHFKNGICCEIHEDASVSF